MNAIQTIYTEADVSDDVPVIDLSDYDSPEGRARIARALREACTSIGFFAITGHGIPLEIMNSVFRTGARYFSLPLEERRKHSNDFKRGFVWLEGRVVESYEMGFDIPADDPDAVARLYLHGPNFWPEDQPWLRAAFEPYNLGVLALGEKLQRLFALSLDLDENFFVDLCRKPTLHMRVLHYLRQEEHDRVRELAVPEHSDYGMFTILMQDPAGGLEIQRRDGSWIRTPQVEGSLVVNVGDMLEIWTNDLYVSTPHRVLGLKGSDRMSAAAFFAPSFRTRVECIGSCLAPGETARHKPLVAGEYLWDRLARLYDKSIGGRAQVGSHRSREEEVADG